MASFPKKRRDSLASLPRPPPSHEPYLAELRKRHGIKRAFWALVK